MNITLLAQWWVQQVIEEGDLAVDATVGNGHDTAFLARVVGPTGAIAGFDVQQQAIANTRERALEEGWEAPLSLYCESHAHIAERLRTDFPGRKAKAVMFNLGFLPGGDKSITTASEPTMEALDASIHVLDAAGLLTVVLYPGHPEGARETEAVTAWASGLRPPLAVACTRLLNRSADAPRLIVVRGPG